MFFRSCFFRSATKIRCLPCAQGVSPYIDRVVSTPCFYPVEDMKGIVGHSPLWRAAYWITPAWNTKSPAENRSKCSAEPASSSHAAHLRLQRGLGHGYLLFTSLCTSMIWGWKPWLTHSHLIQVTAVCQGGFVDLVNNKTKDWISNTATTAFSRVPTCNSSAPKPSLLLHACNQFVSGVSDSTGLDA